MPATVFVVYCVGSNWPKRGCGLTKLLKIQLAMVGKLNEFRFNFLMLFVTLKFYSHSHLVETALQSDFKSWWDISLGILFSWKLWLEYLCVNKTHFHTEYQCFWPVFKTKYICVTESVCVVYPVMLLCTGDSMNLLWIPFPNFGKKLPAVYWLCLSHLFCCIISKYSSFSSYVNFTTVAWNWWCCYLNTPVVGLQFLCLKCHDIL